MSVFDKLKYPLSNHPTLEELDNLSAEIKIEFLKIYTVEFFTAKDMDSVDKWDSKRISGTLRHGYYGAPGYIIRHMRKYIEELP